MSGFNRMTIVAAVEVISDWQSHSDMELLEVQWAIDGQCKITSKSARAADWARIAIKEDQQIDSVKTELKKDGIIMQEAVLKKKVEINSENHKSCRKILTS